MPNHDARTEKMKKQTNNQLYITELGSTEVQIPIIITHEKLNEIMISSYLFQYPGPQ